MKQQLHPKMTLQAAWDAYCELRRSALSAGSKTTYEGKWSALGYFMNLSKPICAFTSDDIAYCMKNRIAKGVSRATLGTDVGVLRQFFTWACQNELLDQNPVQQHKLPAFPQQATVRRQPFTAAQYEKVLVAIGELYPPKMFKHERTALEWRIACSVGFWTGMRVSDCLSLRWEKPGDEYDRTWLDMVEEIITCHPKKKWAKRERLEIPIEPELYEILQSATATRISYSPFVMPTMEEMYRKERRTIVSQFQAICKRAGLPEHSFHSFRHGFVSRLVNAGVDPIIIGSMTGQCVQVIQRYSHVSHEARRASLSRVREALHESRRAQLGFQSSRI